MMDMVINMTAGLIAVIMLIFLLAYIYKKNQREGAGIMSIKQYLSLGPKRGFAALKVGNEIMIVGISPTDFKLLKTYDEEALKPMDFKKLVTESVKQNEESMGKP
jgi:flagellar biogenesis protein FliO